MFSLNKCLISLGYELQSSQALSAALSSDSESPGSIVAHVLFLENYLRERSYWKWPLGAKMSVLGCLMLQSIFQYPHVCLKLFHSFKPHSSSLQCHMAAINLRFVVAAADCSLFTYFFNRFFFGSFATSLSSLAFGLYVAVTMSSFSHHFDRFSDLVILKSVVATLFLEQLYSNL